MQSTDASAYDYLGRPASAGGEQHFGQVRMAYRLADAYRDRLLHVHGIGWHYWDGRRWAEDTTGHAKRAVLDVLSRALAESLTDKQLRADVTRCESAAGIGGTLDVAAALVEFAVTVDDLDADPHLLNTATGTLDLRTMEIRGHDPADRLSKITGAGYRPDADPHDWAAFLERVLPDPDERAYLQRLIGHALLGRVREQVFPVLTGTGANGKSVLTTTLAAALGDYAATVDPALLMANDRNRLPGPELMQLLGTRLVIAAETNEGHKLDEAVMKRLTGGDPITARNLYRPPITWTPTHLFTYVTNKLPAVKGNDPAVWRRIRVIPFNVVIPPNERDPELTERLLLHTDSVLAWAVAGWQEYSEKGLSEPAAVLAATEAYQADSDAVARFVTEACMTSLASTSLTRELYAAWESWALRDGAERLSEKAFGAELDRLGYPAKRTKRGMLRAGLTPYSDDETERGCMG